MPERACSPVLYIGWLALFLSLYAPHPNPNTGTHRREIFANES